MSNEPENEYWMITVYSPAPNGQGQYVGLISEVPPEMVYLDAINRGMTVMVLYARQIDQAAYDKITEATKAMKSRRIVLAGAQPALNPTRN